MPNIIPNLMNDLSVYIAKKTRSDRTFHNPTLTQEKIKIATAFQNAARPLSKESWDDLLQLRKLLLACRLQNAILEVNHSIEHISYSENRLLGRNPIISKLDSDLTQSALQSLLEKHLAKIDNELPDIDKPADVRFALFSLAKLMSKKMEAYDINLNQSTSSGYLGEKKQLLIENGIDILNNIMASFSAPAPHSEVNILQFFELVVYALQNDNRKAETEFNKNHVSYKENRNKGMSQPQAFFSRTFFQSRLNILTEDLLEFINDFKVRYSLQAVQVQPQVQTSVGIGTLSLHMPQGLTVLRERTNDRPAPPTLYPLLGMAPYA